MIIHTIQAIFFLGFPALVLKMCRYSRILNMAGPVILCYAAGLLMANIPLLEYDIALSKTFVELSVPLAIILLLFPTDFIGWFRQAGSAILSFSLCIISVLISAIAACYIFSFQLPEIPKVAGMLVGVYTGGTPNMSAVGLALGVKSETFILINSADIVAGGIYLLFLMSIAQQTLLRFLPAFKKESEQVEAQNCEDAQPESQNVPRTILAYFNPMLISLCILLISTGISLLLSGAIQEIIVILAVTTLGIGASFIPKIRQMERSYPAGEYMLMIFCISVGSLADFQQLLNSSVAIFLCVAFVMFGAILIHFLLAAFFRIDADTVLITSTAGIFGPAFVPVIAKALKNKKILISGLTTGLVGYAVATYLGIALYYVLG